MKVKDSEENSTSKGSTSHLVLGNQKNEENECVLIDIDEPRGSPECHVEMTTESASGITSANDTKLQQFSKIEHDSIERDEAVLSERRSSVESSSSSYRTLPSHSQNISFSLFSDSELSPLNTCTFSPIIGTRCLNISKEKQSINRPSDGRIQEEILEGEHCDTSFVMIENAEVEDCDTRAAKSVECMLSDNLSSEFRKGTLSHSGERCNLLNSYEIKQRLTKKESPQTAYFCAVGEDKRTCVGRILSLFDDYHSELSKYQACLSSYVSWKEPASVAWKKKQSASYSGKHFSSDAINYKMALHSNKDCNAERKQNAPYISALDSVTKGNTDDCQSHKTKRRNRKQKSCSNKRNVARNHLSFVDDDDEGNNNKEEIGGEEEDEGEVAENLIYQKESSSGLNVKKCHEGDVSKFSKDNDYFEDDLPLIGTKARAASLLIDPATFQAISPAKPAEADKGLLGTYSSEVIFPAIEDPEQKQGQTTADKCQRVTQKMATEKDYYVALQPNFANYKRDFTHLDNSFDMSSEAKSCGSLDSDGIEAVDCASSSTKSEKGVECPLCQKEFPRSEIEQHASDCNGISDDMEFNPDSQSSVEEIQAMVTRSGTVLTMANSDDRTPDHMMKCKTLHLPGVEFALHNEKCKLKVQSHDQISNLEYGPSEKDEHTAKRSLLNDADYKGQVGGDNECVVIAASCKRAKHSHSNNDKGKK